MNVKQGIESTAAGLGNNGHISVTDTILNSAANVNENSIEKTITAQDSTLDIFTVFAKPELLIGSTFDPINNRRIMKTFPLLYGSSTIQTKFAILENLGLLSKINAVDYEITELGITTADKLSKQIESRFHALETVKSEYEKLDDAEKAELMMSRHKGLKLTMTTAIIAASEDVDGTVRENPLCVKLKLKAERVRPQLQLLQQYGLIDSLNRPTETARKWNEKFGELSTAQQPAKEKQKAVKANLPVKEKKVSAKRQEIAPEKKKEVKPLKAAPKIKASEKNDDIEARISEKSMQKIEDTVSKTITESRRHSDTLKDPEIRNCDNNLLRKLGPTKSIDILDAVKQIGKLTALLKQSSLTSEFGEPEYSVRDGRLRVRFNIADNLIINELITFINSQREFVNNLPKYSPEKVPQIAGSLYELLTSDKLGLLRNGARLLRSLTILRDNLEQLQDNILSEAGNEKLNELYQKAKSDFREDIFRILSISDDSAARRMISSTVDNLSTVGARMVNTVLQTQVDVLIHTLTAFSLFRCGEIAGDVPNLSGDIKTICDLAGLRLKDLKAYNKKGRLPFRTNLPAEIDEKDSEMQFNFESLNCPDASFTVERNKLNSFSIQSLNISKYAQQIKLLYLIRDFEIALMQHESAINYPAEQIEEKQLQFNSHREFSSKFRPPAITTGEIWITDGHVSGNWKIVDASFVIKLRYKDNSKLVYAFEILNFNKNDSELSIKKVLEDLHKYNLGIINKEITRQSSLKIAQNSSTDELKIELNQDPDTLLEAAEWLRKIGDATTQGRLNEAYFSILARYPQTIGADAILDCAVSLTECENSIKRSFKDASLSLDTISFEENVLEFRFRDFEAGVLKLLTYYLEPKSKNRHVKLDRDIEVSFSKDSRWAVNSMLSYELIREIAKSNLSYNDLISINRDIFVFRRLFDRGRIDYVDGEAGVLAVLSSPAIKERINAQTLNLLCHMTSQEIEIAIRALHIYGPDASKTQVEKVDDLLSTITRYGFSDAKLLNMESFFTVNNNSGFDEDRFRPVDGMPHPFQDSKHILLTNDRDLMLSGKDIEPEYIIDLKWNYPNKALLPEVRKIYIGKNTTSANLKLAFNKIQTTLRKLVDIDDLDLAQALKLKTEISPNKQMDMFPGDKWTGKFESIKKDSTRTWITDGIPAYEKGNNEVGQFSLHGDHYGILIVPINNCDLVSIQYSYLRPNSTNEVKSKFRATLNKIFEYNLKTAQNPPIRQKINREAQ